MIFLPVAERELRVASRKASTFWLRIAAALVVSVFVVGFIILVSAFPAGFGLKRTIGPALFTALQWLCLAAALSAGVFFTADCLSEEKREGTLGFLFLTDLRGYDVVAGKLLASSLRGFYAVLAVLPILGIAMVWGGVAGIQFWKVSLALVNGLFLSLSAGLFASALSRDSQRAMFGALLLLIVWVGLGPLTDAAVAAKTQSTFNPVLSLSSPGYLMVAAGAWGRTPFWDALAANQFIAWILLGCTCLILPGAWQEKSPIFPDAGKGWRYALKFGTVQQRERLRRRLMDLDPVGWLVSRDRWPITVVWLLAALMTANLLALLVGGGNSFAIYLAGAISGIGNLIFYIGTAAHAARFSVDAKRSGLLELLLVSPLQVKEIVNSQWRAYLRTFALPLIVCFVVQVVGSFVVQRAQWNQIKAASPPAPLISWTNSTSITTTKTTTVIGVTGFTGVNPAMIWAFSTAGLVTTAANLVALTWFSLWMGINSRGVNIAALKSLVFVEIIPWFAFTFISTLSISLLMFPLIFKGIGQPSQMIPWIPMLTSGVVTILSVAKDIAFCIWSRRKLYREFREKALEVAVAIPPIIENKSVVS